MSRVSRIDQNPEFFRQVVAKSRSVAEVMRELGYKYSAGQYKFIKQKMLEYELDWSHMKGQGWANGKNRDTDPGVAKMAREHELAWEQCFRKGSNIKNQNLLKRLLKSGKRDYKCESCHNSSWMGKPISLVLHHKNDINDDNREENLTLLCPNCHDQGHGYGQRIAKWYFSRGGGTADTTA